MRLDHAEEFRALDAVACLFEIPTTTVKSRGDGLFGDGEIFDKLLTPAELHVLIEYRCSIRPRSAARAAAGQFRFVHPKARTWPTRCNWSPAARLFEDKIILG